MNKWSIVFTAASLMLGLGAGAANAYTLSIGGTPAPGEGLKSSVPGAVTVTFDEPIPSLLTYSAGATVVQGNVGGQYAAPPGDGSKYLTISPKGSGVVGASGPITITASQDLKYFGFYAGSLDSYNSIKFLSKGVTVGTFGGTQLAALANTVANGDQSKGFYYNFAADGAGEFFDTVVMDSSGIAFETDNHAFRTAVPEAGTIAGLAAIGAIGAATLLQRRGQKVA
ncbi:hypothetical protein BST81_21675 [Leptolyngbya sp. 'hensonii']|uniref:Npun_F0296 family exosortase-dependent surface protein n=1 Tax=Leptolyngbya sp. 'hensonii' TaxID=1922337 RepID=UPI00094F9330|nr:hypothetical protein [Leptolyngbya sp. 'hensonii']OLP16217.1 hypothetical protein BST81_21675 [Leptolyngbya sp. 'hensonii']